MRSSHHHFCKDAHTRDKTQYSLLSFEPSAHYQMRNLAAEKQILMQTHIPFACSLKQRASVCVFDFIFPVPGASVCLWRIYANLISCASPHIHITSTCVLIGFLKILLSRRRNNIISYLPIALAVGDACSMRVGIRCRRLLCSSITVVQN